MLKIINYDKNRVTFLLKECIIPFVSFPDHYSQTSKSRECYSPAFHVSFSKTRINQLTNMLIKNYQSFHKFKSGFFNSMLFTLLTTATTFGQARPAPPVAEESSTWLYVVLVVSALGLGGFLLYLRSKKAQKESALRDAEKANGEKDSDSVDGDKELEWLRKNQKLVGKKSKPTQQKKKSQAEPSIAKVAEPTDTTRKKSSVIPVALKDSPVLPIFSINRLELARPFDALPISNDEDLLTAVEQAYDEFEEDEEIRDLAIRILTAFKKRNSVEALSQIALYDLSASLRSKAVSVLSEFDHESVFEPILLANADPTREVRAAAARGLSKLSFDRADAWTRIAETGEEGRIAQAARAAIESGFVDMSFDRLVSKDQKQAYEAFALMALLIKAGETGKIFHALENNPDTNVRRAILHIIKITKDQKALDGLYLLLERNNLPLELQEEIDKTIEEIGFVTA